MRGRGKVGMGRFEARACAMMDGRGGGRTIAVASVDGVGANGAKFYDIANVADLLQGRARDGGGDIYRYSCNRLGEMHAAYRASRATQPTLLLITCVS